MNLIDILIALDSHLHWNVTVNPVEAIQFGRKVDPKLADMVGEISNWIPLMDYGPDNPNTGKAHHKFRIGREYSRVIHLELVKAYFPKGYDYSDLIKRLKKISEKYLTDVFGVEETDTALTVRFWFD
jgi:hypothetical protein